MKCLHECCVCARLFILKCSCVKKKKRKAIESKCLMGKYSYFLYVGCKACIRLYVSGSHLFFSLLSSVCSWQQSIFLPIWCCCTSLEKSTKLHPSIYLCLAFRVFLYRRVHCSRKRGMVSTASSTFHYAPPPMCHICVHVVWRFDRSTPTLINTSVAHIVNGCYRLQVALYRNNSTVLLI